MKKKLKRDGHFVSIGGGSHTDRTEMRRKGWGRKRGDEEEKESEKNGKGERDGERV